MSTSISDRTFAWQKSLARFAPEEQAGGWLEVSPPDGPGVGEAVRAARTCALPVWIVGSGSKDTFPPPTGPGLILNTRKLNAPPVLSAANLTANVPAGMALASINPWLAPHGLFWPVEDAFESATVGGVVSCCISGSRRLGYGALRDQILALELVNAEGEVIRTGRPTMKDVAAYNLTRLVCGAWGTLGVVTRATLRLSPIPQASASVAVRFASAEQAFAALMPLLRQAPLPAAADWLGCPGPEGELLLRFDGEPAGVAYQRDRAVLVLRANSGAGALRDAIDDESVWIERRNVFTRLSRQSPIRLRIGVPPGRAGEAAKLLQTGRIPSADWTCGYLGSGILIAGFERAPSSDAIRQLQTQATAIGGYLSLEAGPPQLRNALLPHESMAPSAVREGLAKGRVFNPHIRL